MKFENQRGKYMMHCHNLVHEDHDMMTQFQVGDMDRAQDPHDPIEADKCKDFKDMGELFRPKPNNSGNGNGNGNGNAEERGNDTISVPADIPAEPAAAAAPASGAPAAPAAPKPGIKVLGSKRKSKVKVKPRRKVKAKAKKVTAKKPVSKTTAKKPAAKKLGARKSPSARALKVRRGRM
jgi:hypothetical protein